MPKEKKEHERNPRASYFKLARYVAKRVSVFPDTLSRVTESRTPRLLVFRSSLDFSRSADAAQKSIKEEKFIKA